MKNIPKMHYCREGPILPPSPKSMHSVLVMYCDPDNELRADFKVTKCRAIDLKLFQAASTEPKLTF